MKEKLIEILQMFLEKYFLTTIVSIVITFLTYYKTSPNNSMLIKFGTTGYGIFFFCIWFLILNLFITSINKLCDIFSSMKLKVYYNQESEKESLELLWSEVDKMSLPDYQLLMNFIDSGNQPYYKEGTFFGNCLLNSTWVYKTQVEYSRNKYILKDEIYQILKYSKDKYGKISHFNR